MGRSEEKLVEDCTRVRVEIDGENYYITVGDDFIVPTVPRENHPTMFGTRRIVETLCKEISRIMRFRRGKNEQP